MTAIEPLHAINRTCQELRSKQQKALSYSIIKIDNALLLPIALSDHKGILCQATLSPITKRTARWRFYNTLLGNEHYRSQFLTQLNEFLEFNIGSVEDPRVLWDAVKGFIRSNAILFS